MNKLYIGNLNDKVTVEELVKLFEDYNLVYVGEFLLKTGYAFVDCPDDQWAMKAIEAFSGELSWFVERKRHLRLCMSIHSGDVHLTLVDCSGASPTVEPNSRIHSNNILIT